MRARSRLPIAMLCLVLAGIPAAATAASPPDRARRDAILAAMPDWGPATAADVLDARVYAGRVLEDEPAFRAALDSLWALDPHRDYALDAGVLWATEHHQARALLDATTAARAGELLGLRGLDESDLRLVRGLSAFYLNLDATAQALLSGSAAESPPRPAALSSLAWLEARGSNATAALEAALASPEAAVDVLVMMILSDPTGPLGAWREAAVARLATLPPRPQLRRMLAAAECEEEVRGRGLTAASFGAALDRLHAREPVAFASRLDDLLEIAAVWLEPTALRQVVEARADWLPATRLRDARASLARDAGRGHEAYRLYREQMDRDGGDPDGHLIALAPRWDADAEEAAGWARRAIAAPGDADYDDIAWVLEMQGRQAEADSARAAGERERLLVSPFLRILRLAAGDGAAATALLDSLRGERPAYSLLPAELFLAEARGDTTYLAGLQREQGDFALATALPMAAGGAAQRGDRPRLARLERWAREVTPLRRSIWRLAVDAALTDGDLRAADELIAGRLPALAGGPAAIDWSDVAWDDARLALQSAMLANRPELLRKIVESLLARPDVDADDLVVVPRAAEAAGLPELADRVQARLEALAPGAPETVLSRGRLLLERGDLPGARAAVADAAARWPEAPWFREVVAATGDDLDRDPDSPATRDLTAFGELGLEYEATDWILARAEPVAAQPSAGQVVLQDRYTVVFQSHEALTLRHRFVTEVLSDAGGAEFTPFRFAFEGPEGAPRVVCARVISPQGEVRVVPQSDVMVTAHKDESADVSDRRDMVIPFTNVKPGSIVDICIETTPRTSFAGAIWTHRFGNAVRQREEVLEFVVPHDLPHLVADADAPLPAERRELSGGRLYRWSVPDLPAVVSEGDAPPLAAFPHWVGCTTTLDWAEVGRRYAVDFWGRTEPDDTIRKLAKERTAGVRGNAEKLEKLFAFVREEVDNVGVESGRGWYVPSPASEVARRRYGDCKEKVALLTALLSAAGLECQPVLVGTRPSEVVLDGYPNAGAFNHLVAFVPGVDGGVFCDPTLGQACRAALPTEVCGQRGLLMARDGACRLVTLPEHDDHEAELEYVVDLRPGDDGSLLAEVAITARHDTAFAGNGAFAVADSAAITKFVRVLSQPKTGSGFELRKWTRTVLPCGAWRVDAVVRDSSWADGGEHDARVAWLTYADDLIGLEPGSARDRRLPLALDCPIWGRVTVRAHESAGWQLATRMAPVSVDGPGFAGSVAVAERAGGADRWLEVRRETHVTRREYAAAETELLVERYNRHKLGCLQPFVWRRREDESRVGKLVAYTRANPADVAFANQAARQLLGPDLGGDGEAGQERRRQVRELLAPALAQGGDASLYLVMARMARRDDRWFEADSLLTHALTLAPREPELLLAAIYVKRETSQYADAIELLRRHQAVTGDTDDAYTIVLLQVALGRDEDAAREIERLRLVAPKVNEAWLLSSRLTGYLRSHRPDEARRAFAADHQRLGAAGERGFDLDLADVEHRWEDSIAIADSLLLQSPLDSGMNNNLAWYLACAGRELDRAEYAIGVSLAVATSNRADNTLALVQLRQGRVDEARELLVKLLADDRPASRVSNGYLLGLSYWLEGNRERALATWRQYEGLDPFSDLGAVLGRSLAAAERGEDPSWLYLRNPAARG